MKQTWKKEKKGIAWTKIKDGNKKQNITWKSCFSRIFLEGATGQWARLAGTQVQCTGYMGATSWYSGATSGYIATYWQSTVRTFADRFPYLSQLCCKNHCLKPSSKKNYLVHFGLEAFVGDRNNQLQAKKENDKNASSRANSVGSGLGHVQTVFLHDSTLVVLFTHWYYLHFHFLFKLSNQMCFGPSDHHESCFP